MDDNMKTSLVKLAVLGVAVYIAIPILKNCAVIVTNGVQEIRNYSQHNRKLKKGLKEGTIVEIDGQYYEFDSSNITVE
jgi:uncharacterized protein YaaN involved in tellurite resistance